MKSDQSDYYHRRSFGPCFSRHRVQDTLRASLIQSFRPAYPSKASSVDMLVATSRLSFGDSGTLFGGERSTKPSLTDINISIPADSTRKEGDVQWPKKQPPNPKTVFAVISVKPMTSIGQGLAWFRKHGNSGHALVFVHGFNNNL